MKFLKYILIYSLIFIQQVSGQHNLDRHLIQINRQIDSIVHAKSSQFQQAFNRINRQLEQGEINVQEAQAQKKQLAKQYAEDLDYTVYKLTGDLKHAVKGSYIMDSIVHNETAYHIRRVKLYRKKYYDRKVHKNKRSYAFLFLATGLNNVIDRDKVQSIEFSPYGYLQSRFFELGMDWKTNIMHHKTFLTYGFSFVWHTLKPTDNKYHVVENDTVKIVAYPNQLSTSKLRHIWLKFPLSLELNLPQSTRGHLHLSAGVYGKFRLTTKQKLTYLARNQDHDEVIKNDFMMPAFAYGLTGGIGGSDWSIYANYDITPLFKNSHTHLISLGLKWRL